ncbi:MAG: leucine-rich repeat domain-containing protein [Deltaproteobacteria bacterium]|nr:leucine-rich repeat domain-containing protein [Deltaproteobacteria bacterium]MBN2671620.1 leucine-rich repeat domain-containing protein [Deltaproteobacteria bacterium]
MMLQRIKMNTWMVLFWSAVLLGQGGCQLVVPDLKPASDNGSDSEIDTDSDSDSDTGTEAPLGERERCVTDGGYWYDETDVDAQTLEEFEALAPTCHETATENCVGVSSVRYAIRDNGEFLEADITTTTIYESGENQENLITHVFSTLRCIPNLASIAMRHNRVQKVDLNANERLTFIDFYDNHVLYELYIPRIPYVTELHLNTNALATIDLSTAQALEVIYLSGNNLTEINLRQCPSLTFLYIPGNNIVTEIDLSQNNNLEQVEISGNPLQSLIMPESPLSLWQLNVNDTQISSIDLTGCIRLEELNVSETQIAALNVADAGSSLESLGAESTRIQTLDLTYNVALRAVSLAGNNLTQVTLPTNSPIYYFDVSYSTLSFAGGAVPININVLTQLQELNLWSNTYLNLADIAPLIPDAFWQAPGAILHIEEDKWIDYADRPDTWVYDTESWYAHN